MLILIACPLGFLGLVFLVVGMATFTPAMTGVKPSGRGWLAWGVILLMISLALGVAAMAANAPRG